MKNVRWVIAGVVVLVGLLLAAGYIVQQTYTPPASATSPVTPEVRQFSLHLLASKEGERVVRHWIPAVIVVNAGDNVILRITNGDDESAHGFTLGAVNVVVPPIPPGQTVTVRFKASRPGIFHYGCNVVGCATDHADQIGQFIVMGER